MIVAYSLERSALQWISIYSGNNRSPLWSYVVVSGCCILALYINDRIFHTYVCAHYLNANTRWSAKHLFASVNWHCDLMMDSCSWMCHNNVCPINKTLIILTSLCKYSQIVSRTAVDHWMFAKCFLDCSDEIRLPQTLMYVVGSFLHTMINDSIKHNMSQVWMLRNVKWLLISVHLFQMEYHTLKQPIVRDAGAILHGFQLKVRL